MKDIKTNHKSLVDHSGCMSLWVKEFEPHVSSFQEKLGDFEAKNLEALFRYIYEHKCQENITELMECFDDVMTIRLMYLHVKLTYYSHATKFSGNEKEFAVTNEMEGYTRDVETIVNSVQNVCLFFHEHKLLPKDVKFKRGTIR